MKELERHNSASYLNQTKQYINVETNVPFVKERMTHAQSIRAQIRMRQKDTHDNKS